MQGGVFGGLEASLQIDLLGKDCLQSGKKYFKNSDSQSKPIYLYKESLHVPPLSFVDDVVVFSKCETNDSIILSTKTEEFMKSKKLTLSVDKCHTMHIGKKDNGKCNKTNKINNK